MGKEILLLRGLPGVGKTTTSTLLRERRPPAVRVSNDSVRYMAMPRDFSALTIEASELACIDLAASYAGSGFLPVIDGVFNDPGFLDAQTARLASAGHTLKVFTLWASLDELLIRNYSRHPFDQMDSQRVADLYAGFSSYGVEINIHEKEPEEVADGIMLMLTR